MYLISRALPQLKFIFSTLLISCVILSQIEHVTAQDNKWQEEIKDVLTRMDVKLAIMESKVGGFNALEYAFQINSGANRLDTLEKKMVFLLNLLNEVKQSVQNSCQGSSAVSLQQSRASGQNENYAGQLELSNEIIQKIDDYGNKLVSFYQELVEDEKSQKNSLSVLLETARSGFSKLYEKVDQFASFERQFEGLSISARNLLPLIAELHEQQTNFTSEFMEMNTKEVLDKQSIANISKELIQVLGHNMSAVKMVQNNELSDYLTRALAHGKAVAKGFLKYPDILGNVTSALQKANELKTNLVDVPYYGTITDEDSKRFDYLPVALEAVERDLNFLGSSVSLSFQSMEALIKEARSALFTGNSTCGHKELLRFDIPAINILIREIQKYSNFK